MGSDDEKKPVCVGGIGMACELAVPVCTASESKSDANMLRSVGAIGWVLSLSQIVEEQEVIFVSISNEALMGLQK